jgi:hypothetical protein
MWVTRARLGSALEWALAAGCILALAALVSLVAGELRNVRSLTAVLADEGSALPSAELPATIPAGAVSVPLLLLSNGSQLQIGQTASDIAARISAAWQIGADAFERTARGARVTRSYDDGARRFLLVFDRAESAGEDRVAAIYLQ